MDIFTTAIIIGWGMVGKSTGHALGIENHIDLENKLIDSNLEDYQYFILCLPTPTIKGKQDLSALEEWLKKIKALKTNPIVVIRSTILPGTTDQLSAKYGLQIAHVPEFLSEATAIADARNPQLLVIGARDILVKEKVRALFTPYQVCIEHQILCDPITAEMIKYTMNSFFALKVIFGNQIWDVAQTMEADYNKIAEALEAHKWGSKNGWNVWQGGKRGYGGRCLPKDTEAFVDKFTIPLLQKMVEINKGLINE